MPLTPIQKQTSHCISASVLTFPAVVSDLISQYQVDYYDAGIPMHFDARRYPINPEIIERIKDALISSECPPLIKRNIFKLAQEWGYKVELNKFLFEIREQGYRLNLDGVDLSHLNLSSCDLRGMSAVGCNFSHAKLTNAKINSADLTGAILISTDLQSVDFSGTILHKSCISNSNLRHALMTRTNICSSVINNVKTDETIATGMITDDVDMQTVLIENLKWNSSGDMVTVLSQPLFDQAYFNAKIEKYRLCCKPRA